MTKSGSDIFHSLFNNPAVFDSISKYFSDHAVVGKVIGKEIDLAGKKRILDLGCGTGSLSRMFPSENYTGVDFDKKYIDFARKNYNKNFLVMDASDLKFESDYFDFIFTKDVFHHLTDEVFLKTLSEMKRVLKPAGQVLIIEISYLPSEDLFYKKIIRKIDRGRYIREFNILRELVLRRFIIEKGYLEKGMWGDLAVFLAGKGTG